MKNGFPDWDETRALLDSWVKEFPDLMKKVKVLIQPLSLSCPFGSLTGSVLEVDTLEVQIFRPTFVSTSPFAS